MTRRQHGFTLLEMLVALSVAGLLVGLVYGAVRIGQRSAESMSTQVEQAEVMRVGWQYVHDALSRARPIADPDDPEDTTGFDGTAHVLRFVADMPAYLGLGGLMRITLEIDETTEARRLVLSRQRLGDGDEPPADIPAEQTVLVDDLEGLEIAYFGEAGRAEAADWHDSWQGQATLPSLVRIHVKPSDTPAWPGLTASPWAGGVVAEEIAASQDSEAPEDEATPAEAAPEPPPTTEPLEGDIPPDEATRQVTQ